MYQIEDGCPNYMRNELTASITFSLIQNPFYVLTTDVMSVYIYDYLRNPIAELALGPTLTTTVNTLQFQSVAIAEDEVNAVTSVEFTIRP